ncbi:MAG: hypothetical protein V4787_05980 [Pseudomonadota bacterium]
MSAVLQSSDPAWERIALGVQRALRVERESVFPVGELMPVSLPGLARVPYLGWVGPRFRGTVIVGKNPGGGGDSQTDVKPHDRAVADALLALKAAAQGQAGDALHGVYRAFTAQAPTIGMGTLLGRVLEALGEAREEVAFVNLCPFRTRMDKDPTAGAARRSASLVLAPLVEALHADTVVLMGAVAGRAAPELQARWVYKLKRRINDYQLHPEAAQRLGEMRASREERAACRVSHGS